MYSVTVCVVFVIIGNLSGSVVRTRRDLEQTIHDFYGPPSIPRDMQHHPHHMPSHRDHTAMKYDEEDPKVHIPQEVLDSLFGPPVNKSSQDAKASVHHFYSAIFGDEREKRPSLEAEVKEIFGSPPPEAMSATENSTASNSTVDFSTDDRFLSRSMMRTQWAKNRQETSTEEMPKHTEKTELNNLPNEEEPQHAGLGKERRILEPGPLDHSQRPVDFVPLVSKSLEPRIVEPKLLEPKSRINGCDKNFTSKFFVVVFVCVWLERFFI